MLIDPNSTQKGLDYRNLLWALGSEPLFPEHAAAIHTPNQIEAFSVEQPNRIGHYFENLIEHYLRNVLCTPKIHPHEKIKDGELDFLFLDPESQRWKHWEVALKFYFYEPENGLYWGQKRQDRLDIKKDRIINRQMNYSKDSELCARLGIDPALIDRELLVRGRLFNPLDLSHEQPNWWLRGWGNLFVHEKNFEGYKFKILDRKEWLADPIEFPLSMTEMKNSELPHSTMLAILSPSGRINRGFILEKTPDLL